jgi:hypothetical protein
VPVFSSLSEEELEEVWGAQAVTTRAVRSRAGKRGESFME